MAVAALTVRDLSFSYADQARVLSRLSFEVAPGERVALLGPNGAGKSTLLWCLVGILPAQGEISVDGTALRPGSEAEVRAKLGLAFAEPEDQLFMPTVKRDVMFGPLAAGLGAEQAEQAAAQAVRSVGLPESALERAAHELSSGERRRAALASLLVQNPLLLALDEPTNSLDAGGRASLADLLLRLPCAQLIATHDLEFAQALCPRALVLVNGELVADTTIHALLGDPDRLQQYRLLAPLRKNYGKIGLL